MLDEPLMRAPRDDDAVARSRSIYRCAHRRYPSAAPVASFLPHIVVDTQISSRKTRSGDGEAYAALRRRKDWNEKLKNLESLDYEVIDNRW